MKTKVVKFNILGQDYVVRSAAGQKYLEKVAAYVDAKMEEITGDGNNIWTIQKEDNQSMIWEFEGDDADIDVTQMDKH